MKNKKLIIALVLTGAVLAAVLVICAVVFAPPPVVESVTMEAGSEQIPLMQFPKEDKIVTLVTDVSGIDLKQPGEYTL